MPMVISGRRWCIIVWVQVRHWLVVESVPAPSVESATRLPLALKESAETPLFSAIQDESGYADGLMRARGLSTDGQAADGTECLDCIQTHEDQARAVIERDKRMEAEFAKSEAARPASGGKKQ